jgi:hypothetical protein
LGSPAAGATQLCSLQSKSLVLKSPLVLDSVLNNELGIANHVPFLPLQRAREIQTLPILSQHAKLSFFVI